MPVFKFYKKRQHQSEKGTQKNIEGKLPSPPPENQESNEEIAEKPLNDTHIILTDLSREGYRHIKNGELSKALSSFRKIMEIEPDNHYALVGIGDVYRKELRFQEARKYYQRCLEFQPRNNYALFGLADCLRQQNHFHQAIDVWEEYLQFDSQNVTVLTRVADAYRKIRNSKRSEELYIQVLELEPRNSYALTGLGHLHYNRHNYDRSLEYWNQIYHEQGLNADIRVLTSIGNCYRKLKSFNEGTTYFKAVLTKEDRNFYALFGLADCYRGLHYLDKSLVYWNRILERDPRNKLILTRAGDAYRQQQQLNQAEDYYERALSIKYDTYAILGLAMIYIIRQEYEEAANRLEGLLKNHARNHRIYPVLMECYVSLRDRAAAVQLLGRFNELRDVREPDSLRMNDLKQRLGISDHSK